MSSANFSLNCLQILPMTSVHSSIKSKFNFGGASHAFYEGKMFSVIVEYIYVSDSCSRVCVRLYPFEITSLQCLKSRFCHSIYSNKVAVTLRKVSMGCISDL